MFLIIVLVGVAAILHIVSQSKNHDGETKPLSTRSATKSTSHSTNVKIKPWEVTMTNGKVTIKSLNSNFHQCVDFEVSDKCPYCHALQNSPPIRAKKCESCNQKIRPKKVLQYKLNFTEEAYRRFREEMSYGSTLSSVFKDIVSCLGNKVNQEEVAGQLISVMKQISLDKDAKGKVNELFTMTVMDIMAKETNSPDELWQLYHYKASAANRIMHVHYKKSLRASNYYVLKRDMMGFENRVKGCIFHKSNSPCLKAEEMNGYKLSLENINLDAQPPFDKCDSQWCNCRYELEYDFD